MSDSMKIYVAGPYSADTEGGKLDNTNRAIEVGLDIFKKGHYPYIPHVTYWVDQYAMKRDIPMTYEEYMDWDEEWLYVCDGFFYIESSNGADQELAIAEQEGLEVFRSLDNVPDVS